MPKSGFITNKVKKGIHEIEFHEFFIAFVPDFRALFDHIPPVLQQTISVVILVVIVFYSFIQLCSTMVSFFGKFNTT